MLRFKDYKKENYILVNENPGLASNFYYSFMEDMTDEDKIQFVREYYGCEDTTEMISELNHFLKGIKDGEIKKIRHSDYLHPASVKKWVTNSGYKYIKYGKRSYSYWDTRENECYIEWLDSRKELSDDWRVSSIIRDILDDNSYLNKFKFLLCYLVNAESKHKEANEKKSYESENYLRIKRGEIAYSLYDKFGYRVPIKYNISEYPEGDYMIGSPETVSPNCCGWNSERHFSRNKYGEMVSNITKNILSANEADELTDLILEYSKKIAAIGDEFDARLKVLAYNVKGDKDEA